MCGYLKINTFLYKIKVFSDFIIFTSLFFELLNGIKREKTNRDEFG